VTKLYNFTASRKKGGDEVIPLEFPLPSLAWTSFKGIQNLGPYFAHLRKRKKAYHTKMIFWVKSLSVFGNWRSYLNWRYRTDPKHWYRTFNKYRNRDADPHWFNADPDTDPDPEFLWPKIEKKIYCWKFIFYFLDQKLQVAVINCLAGLAWRAGLTAQARQTAAQLRGCQQGEYRRGAGTA
jgi:hypothetical protein